MKLKNQFGIKVLFATAIAVVLLSQVQEAQAGNWDTFYAWLRSKMGLGY